ncbi:MAG: recombinase family protein [Croceibacterium sp.]
MNKVRCAIYTRKSSEEGLEQDFNSLHAQREACAAYVLSQASEGWSQLPGEYDDGGLSGGSLARPALQRLLADIEAGKIDIVVVYKVDRLTRSLLDFSKLVEAFDKAGTSFVSVTQSFNTTTSMGRLTLNMLLSFAQFEREVTAERIRDKIAASKAKGMWMGGVVPLGYQADGRTLKTVDEHAQLIRELFRRYLDLGSVRLLAERLAAEGVGSPSRMAATGRKIGGGNLSRGQLYAILSNPIYIGMIRHKDTLYQGQHPAIIDRETWDDVREMLAQHTRGAQRGATAKSTSPLAGVVFDQAGEPMLATHACKGSVRYRYYVSRALHQGIDQRGTGVRMPSLPLERAVAEELAKQLDQPLRLIATAGLAKQPHQMAGIILTCREIAERLRDRSEPLLRTLISRVEVGSEQIAVDVNAANLASHLGTEWMPEVPRLFRIHIEARLRRSGKVVRLVQPNGTSVGAAEPQQHLVRLLQSARTWWRQMQDEGLSASELATRENVDKSYVSRVARLSFLSPNIVQQILAGEQHPTLNARRLLNLRQLPLHWQEQERELLAY